MAKGSLKGPIVLALVLLASSGLAHARHGRDSFSVKSSFDFVQ